MGFSGTTGHAPSAQSLWHEPQKSTPSAAIIPRVPNERLATLIHMHVLNPHV